MENNLKERLIIHSDVLPSESESNDMEEEISEIENVRQLLKALTIINDSCYKISETTYQVQFSSKMKSEIENVLKHSKS